MHLGLSTWVYMGLPIEEAIKKIYKSRIRYLELWGDALPHMDPRAFPRERVEELSGVLKALDMRLASLHAPFSGLDISSTDENKREFSVNSTLNSVDLCREMKCPQLVIHVSASPGVRSRTEFSKSREWTVESLHEITDHSSKNGVMILLENMIAYPNHLRLGSEVEDLLELVSLFKGKDVGVCIDTGHSVLNKHSPSEDIRKVGEHLRSLHINDNDGKKDLHSAPGVGIIDWSEVYSALKEVRYAGVFMLEIYGYNVVKETIKKAVAYSRSLLKKGNTNTSLL